MSGLELELQGVGILDEATANARAMGMSLVEFLKMAIRNSYSHTNTRITFNQAAWDAVTNCSMEEQVARERILSATLEDCGLDTCCFTGEDIELV